MRSFIVLALLCATAVAAPKPESKPTIEIVELKAQPAIVRTVKVAPDQLGTAIAGAVMALIGTADRHVLAIAGPPFARYFARGAQVEVEVGVPIRKAPTKPLGSNVRAIELPAGPAATLVYRGRHDDLPRAHAELDRWLASHERTPNGARWEVYMTSPIETLDPAKQETRIVVPLSR